MKRPKRLIIFIFLIIISLAVVRVSIENSVSTTGIELMKLQNKVTAYKKANAALDEKYLEDSSLTTIASKAAEKGFIAAKNQVYLSTPLPLALKQ